LQVERQVLVWFDVPPSRAWYEPESFPVFLCEFEGGRQLYGFPRLQRGVKTAIFHEGTLSASPDSVAREVTPADIAALRTRLGRILPELAVASVRESVTCLFTNTPDGHFLVDVHPAHPQVLLSSPCSGHGFKFASALGEMQADLLLDGRARFDLQPFSLSRFVRQSGAGP
jgi:sarcosine oxidase